MRALYGYAKKPCAKPYCIIFQRYFDLGDPATSNNYHIIGEREVTLLERHDMVTTMKRLNRVYIYESIEALIDDELRSLVLTPNEITENLKAYETRKRTNT
jgi:hypothetical protein